ncbi:response regulator [bacterium]|nr:MAG: response regulator [bacterium]
MRFILVDDEELARTRLRSLIQEVKPDWDCVGEAENGFDAIKRIQKENPEVLFLDIQMPKLNGFETLELIPETQPLQVIFVTAYDEFAIQAFEAHAVDYLLKPVKKARLEKSLNRLELKQESNQSAYLKETLSLKTDTELKRLPVQFKQETIFVSVSDIVWIESKETMTFIHTRDNKQYRIDKTLDELEQRLSSFFRLHRSYLVAVHSIEKLIPWFSGAVKVELENGEQLEVAKRRVSELKKVLGV